MVAVTGVSGSGKSTLVHNVSYQPLAKRMNRDQPGPSVEAEEFGVAPEKLTCLKVEKADLLTQVVLVDQSPIGRTPRRKPVTYIIPLDVIRELFVPSRAAHLAQASSEGTLYIFDEPTTGLHFDDIAKLLDAFERLLRSGGSILIIEHNLEVIRRADWVIDLGPEGGDAGGRIVAEGTPEQVAQVAESYTGRYLKAAM